jgi:hypothetical protein
MMSAVGLARWHRLVRERDFASVAELLSEDVVFHSPVVHTPQRGRVLTSMYLRAAGHLLGNPSFRYVRELHSGSDAVLEFELELDGVQINGVDMIRWDAEGRIVDFKVMLRPQRAMEAVKERMAAMLQGGAVVPT